MLFFDLRNNKALHFFLIAVIGLIAYANTFNSSFHFDDDDYIVKNSIIKDLQFFTDPSAAIDYKTTPGYHTLKMRYIGMLTFALNHKVHGLDVKGYHIVNLAIHLANSMLLYLIVALSFKTPFVRTSLLKSSSDLIALFAGLLFVSHPLQTQAVTYISQRFASLATLFYLLAFLGYIGSRLSASRSKSVILYVLSILFAVLAMKTKEIAFTLPVMLLLYEVIFFDRKVKVSVLYLVPFFLSMLIIPVSLLGDLPKEDIVGALDQALRADSAIARHGYLLTEIRVVATYIRLFLLPINQNVDYDYPFSHSFFGPPTLSAAFLLLSIASFGLYLLYRSKKHELDQSVRLIAFGIFWFFITLAVESGVIPTKDLIFEHRMYLPSVGLCTALITSAFIAVKKFKDRRNAARDVITAGLCVLIVLMTFAAYKRNAAWKDEFSLWSDAASKSPQNARAHNNLGKVYLEMGLIDDAFQHFITCITLNPRYAVGHNSLGTAYMRMGLVDKAEEHYLRALQLEPVYDEPYFNLGILYLEKGFLDRAEMNFKAALSVNPGYQQARTFLNYVTGRNN